MSLSIHDISATIQTAVSRSMADGSMCSHLMSQAIVSGQSALNSTVALKALEWGISKAIIQRFSVLRYSKLIDLMRYLVYKVNSKKQFKN